VKKAQEIYRQGDHAWTILARDPDRPGYIMDTNEYFVSSEDTTLLIDPGGAEIFPAVFSALCQVRDPRSISAVFSSHQDPDVVSSLALWLELNPDLKCYVSWLWSSFIPHFGGQKDTFIMLADEGQMISVGSRRLLAVPAHYLHSSGNFHLYDPEAKILFTGDIGAALLPSDKSDFYVRDFDSHVRYAEAFHQRWLGSNEAKLDWCHRVSAMKVDMICPQHGAIYKGADVQRFINWLAELKVGVLRKPERSQKEAA
jgi:flavorubredoxin